MKDDQRYIQLDICPKHEGVVNTLMGAAGRVTVKPTVRIPAKTNHEVMVDALLGSAGRFPVTSLAEATAPKTVTTSKTPTSEPVRRSQVPSGPVFCLGGESRL